MSTPKPDPVAEKSAFLKMYMSSHPDTLVAYAKFYGKVTEPIKSAEMSAIDTKSMTLKCTLKNGGLVEVKVNIEPPLRDYNDVKPRLLEMKAISQEGLGMIKAPHITTFQFPSVSPLIVINGFILSVIIYICLLPTNPITPLWLPAQKAVSYPYVASVARGALGVTTVIHALECLYTFSLCRRHSMPFVPTVQYVATTLIWGFSIWGDLRKRIQSARIDSVMKVE